MTPDQKVLVQKAEESIERAEQFIELAHRLLDKKEN